jgi:hypothetical protein
MKTLPLRPSRATLSLSKGLLLAALPALAAGPAFADGGPRYSPYRRPAELQQTIEPTAQAHLDAAQRALRLALDQLTDFAALDKPGTKQHRQITILYGGYAARARDELAAALAATGEAVAFVRAHPEANALPAGPAPADEPRTPPQPKLPERTPDGTPYVRLVDAVNVALAALVNNPARDHRGPILGDLGGHRAKIIAAIVQAGTALSTGSSYFKNVRGGNTGIIPITAPADLTADPKYGPTARIYLAEVQPWLDEAGRIIATSGGAAPGDPNQGGYVAKVTEGLRRVSADLAAALTYLDSHPEEDALKAGPAGPELSAGRHTTQTIRPAGSAVLERQPKLNSYTLANLTNALSQLENNPSRDYRGPVLGDIGGYRAKIIDGLNQALADTLAGIAYHTTGQGSAAVIPVPTSVPSTAR